MFLLQHPTISDRMYSYQLTYPGQLLKQSWMLVRNTNMRLRKECQRATKQVYLGGISYHVDSAHVDKPFPKNMIRITFL